MAGDLSASEKPLGTIEELQELNLPLNNHGTCARPERGIKGCEKFDSCKFRPIRDGQLEWLETRTRQDFIHGRGSGPDYIGFQRKVGSNGAMQGCIMLCQDWYTAGNEDRVRDAARTGDAFGPPRYAGQTLKQRYRVEPHRNPETDRDREAAKTCPDCKRGECRLTEERVRIVEIPQFLRPNEALKDIIFGNEIEQEMHEEMQRQTNLQAMEAIAPRPHQELPPLEPHDTGIGKGKGLKSLRNREETPAA